MPNRAVNSVPLMPIGGALAQATTTTAVAIAIPIRAKCVEIVGATAKHYVAGGTSSSAPTLSTTNAGIVQIGGTMTIFPRTADGSHAYLYVAATGSTGTVDVTFYT